MMIEVRTVRPKPIDLQAVAATTDNLQEISDWLTELGQQNSLQGDRLYIQALDGPILVRPGDEILRGPAGFTRYEGGELFEAAYAETGWAEQVGG
jgi:hypothetical protein